MILIRYFSALVIKHYLGILVSLALVVGLYSRPDARGPFSESELQEIKSRAPGPSYEDMTQDPTQGLFFEERTG